MVDYREPGNPRLLSSTPFSAPAVGAAYDGTLLYLAGARYLFFLQETPPPRTGDLDEDGIVSIVDAVFLVNYLFRSGTPPLRVGTADFDGNGRLTMVDLIWLIRILFP
jgi:hypothetical protein